MCDSRWHKRGLAFVSLILIAAGAVRAQATAKDVDASVDRAVAYLLSLQQPDGSWETIPRPKPDAPPMPGMRVILATPYVTYGGETAIATYAALASGQNPQSPAMKKAITWLMNAELHGIYAVSLRCQVWNMIPERLRGREIVLARNRDRDFILASRIQKGPHNGFYGYKYGADSSSSAGRGMPPLDPKGPPETDWYDRSNSQYGVLGAWALEQAGAEIPTQYWLDVDTAWKKFQFADGSWNYNEMTTQPELQTPGYRMTAAGLATLFVTQDYLMRATPHLFDTCRGGFANPNIDRGLAWMDKQVGDALVKLEGWYYYGLYGIERVGLASGRKYFGTVDWYSGGANALVLGQFPDGSFNKTIHDTAFSVLFLSRGRAPLMMNKLIYANVVKKQVDPWNERPRDVANLARWAGTRSLEGFLNWQIVNLQVQPEELHDAPILYMSGSEELNLSAQDIDKLRTFVQQGGMILGNADCGSKFFATSFKKLGSKLFPKYEFRLLPSSHPILDEQFHGAKWKARPALEGMSNGVRELMLLIPQADPGKAWQLEAFKTREESFQLGSNIFLYATGKENLTRKREPYIVKPMGETSRTISVARLQIGENWDPEPEAWSRFAAIIHNTDHLELTVKPIKLGGAELAGFKVAALTGTTKFKLTDEQRQEIRDFVSKGGTLIIDAAGGAVEFADSAEAELKALFPDAASQAELLPPTHAFYTDPRWKIEAFKYRSFARNVLVGAAKGPRVRGVTVDGRVAVFYSREDLTAGLVGEQVDGIIGYDPATCEQIMRAIMLYSEAPAVAK